jgi:hypothetical protein
MLASFKKPYCFFDNRLITLPTTLVAFRIDVELIRKLERIAEAKGIKRPEALRDAVKEYVALYLVGGEPTVGRLKRKIDDLDKRLTALENLLMQKGVEGVAKEK